MNNTTNTSTLKHYQHYNKTLILPNTVNTTSPKILQCFVVFFSGCAYFPPRAISQFSNFPPRSSGKARAERAFHGKSGSAAIKMPVRNSAASAGLVREAPISHVFSPFREFLGYARDPKFVYLFNDPPRFA